MSRIVEVLRNKNKLEKARKSRRSQEMSNIRKESIFRIRLAKEIAKSGMLLDSGEVVSITIEVSDSQLTKFQAAIYQEELADYTVEQVDGNPNLFIIKGKYIAF